MKRIVFFGILAVFSATVLQAQNITPWVIGPFTRPAEGNPVVAPRPASSFTDPIQKAPISWEALHTFNPAAVVRNGKIYVLYRAEDNSGAMEIGGHTSRLGLAESTDGIHFTRLPAPVFYPVPDDQKAREWPGGVEDPRIVERDDGTYVLTYTQWNRETYSVGIATSRDLTHWTKYGPAFLAAAGGKYAHLKYKSAGIVTHIVKDRLVAAKIIGMYWMYWGEGAIHIATSPDLIHWNPVEDSAGNPVELLHPRPGHFDSTFPETGPPPVLTGAGIVVLYNGKNATSNGDPSLGPSAYAAGEALFDPINPAHLLTQTSAPILKPELPYEKTGQYAAGTTFAEGLVWFRKQWFLYYGCADSLVAVATAPAAPIAESAVVSSAPPAAQPSPSALAPSSAAADAQPPSSGPGDVSSIPPYQPTGPFYLKPNDTVVFYGDSITEQNLYNQFVELYTATRFPSMRVHFYGAGVGGDRVTGGGGGPIDQRLARDVFSEKPTVVTVMLGMNDGSYQPTTTDIETTYVKGYQHLIDSIHQHAPGARITLLGPSPFDDVTRPFTFSGGYNAVMQHFADVDRGLAQIYDASFVTLNPSVVVAIQRAQASDPRIAQLLLPDRVHPDPVAHWIMAEALLKGWNAPGIVASVSIDSHSGQLTNAQNATVSNIKILFDGLTWTTTEQSLPLPIARANASQALLMDLTDIQQALNQEPLRVANLSPALYALAIDDTVVASFTAEQLAVGINLADYPTPMFHQAQRVSWLVRDRDESHYIHLRMRVRNADAGQPDVMQAFENSLEDSIYETAKPEPHTFTLKIVGAEPGQSSSN